MPHKLEVSGGNIISGSVIISGAKNAALPILAACILSDKPIVLRKIPNLQDIISMNELLESLGATISFELHSDYNHTYNIDCSAVNNFKADYEIVRKMRASGLVLGSLLGRFGRAEVSLPGGCAIGARPIDLHLYAMEQLGAQIELKDGYVIAEAPKEGLRGNLIEFSKVSVGATENAILAAVLANGKTVIKNAACEPEITDLCCFLNELGAKISGYGTSNIEIEGVKSLKQQEPYTIISDRIEAGTYAMIAAVTHGNLKLESVNPNHLSVVIDTLKKVGIKVTIGKDCIDIDASNNNLQSTSISTEPYPGFPTDLQAQFLTLMGIAKGSCVIEEKIFENRFMHVPELMRMGADMVIANDKVTVSGVDRYQPAQVMATDLRASVSLLMAALNADGTSTINRIYHLDRGYEDLENKLKVCGANLYRIS